MLLLGAMAAAPLDAASRLLVVRQAVADDDCAPGLATPALVLLCAAAGAFGGLASLPAPTSDAADAPDVAGGRWADAKRGAGLANRRRRRPNSGESADFWAMSG